MLRDRKVESAETKQALASQLDSQINNKSQTSEADRSHDVNLGRQLEGIKFECYPRKAEMIRQGYENTSYIVDQMTQNQRRRRDQRNEEMQAPERLWTQDKLDQKKEEEHAEKFYAKVDNTKTYGGFYNKAMEIKAKLQNEQKSFDSHTENGIASIGQRNSYDRRVIDHGLKHEYGGSMRDQLSNNEVKRGETLKEERRAPQVVEDLNQESRTQQAFHLSKKPIITKFA